MIIQNIEDMDRRRGGILLPSFVYIKDDRHLRTAPRWKCPHLRI